MLDYNADNIYIYYLLKGVSSPSREALLFELIKQQIK